MWNDVEDPRPFYDCLIAARLCDFRARWNQERRGGPRAIAPPAAENTSQPLRVREASLLGSVVDGPQRRCRRCRSRDFVNLAESAVAGGSDFSFGNRLSFSFRRRRF